MNPKVPWSIAKQTQRNRQTLMVYIYRRIATVISQCFLPFPAGWIAYNAFLSANNNVATVITTAPDVELVPASMICSTGIIGTTPITNIGFSVGTPDVIVDWSSAAAPANSDPADECALVLWHEDYNEWSVLNFATTATRSDGTVTGQLLRIPAGGETIHVWLVFLSPDHGNSSGSVYSSQVA